MSTPTLRIDTSYLDAGTGDGLRSPISPTARSRARSLSQSVLPSFRSPTAEKSQAELHNIALSHGAKKARNESRKLLAHLLVQLQNRPMPPPSLDSAYSIPSQADKGLGAVVQSVKGAVKHARSKSEGKTYASVPPDDGDSDVEEQAAFSTDVTFELVVQLRDVLLISSAQKWDIFHDSSASFTFGRTSDKLSDSVRNKRSGQASGRRSRVHSHSLSVASTQENAAQAPHLLSQCIAILSSVIAEDSRFRTSSPRPSRPPNALQAVTLDVAQSIIHVHRHDSKVLSQVAFALIPAFYTFNPVMHTRLLTFFDEGVLGIVSDELMRIQGIKASDLPFEDMSLGSAHQSEPPAVSILVEQAEDTESFSQVNLPWRRWSKGGIHVDGEVHSTHAPGHSISVYQLSGIIPPLLAAILENVELSSDKLPTVHRFHRLLSRIVKIKPDAYLDFLEVVAYHTPKARYSALSVLLSYWSKAIGHLAVSKPFPIISYSASLARATTSYTKRFNDHPHAHQFVPWRFTCDCIPALFDGSSQNECRSCLNRIDGFGLLCPFCMCAVHFDCYDYPEGSYFSQYSMSSEDDKQKIAVYRFCHVLPYKRESLPPMILQQQHTFRLVNLFGLTLCLLCRLPLWGCVAQGLRCTSCKQFVHSFCLASARLPRCRSIAVDHTYLTIDWSAMRASFKDYYGDFLLTDTEIGQRTYEEVSTYFGVLWLELQILQHGVALGSVNVSYPADAMPREGQLARFELHDLLDSYEAYLTGTELTVSDALIDHLFDNNLRPQDASVFFDWRILTFVASTIKMPFGITSATPPSSSDLLSVGQPDPLGATPTDKLSYPFEILPLAHLRDQLGDQLHLFSESAARHMLIHLSHLGFFQRLDCQQILFDNVPDPEIVLCYFPLPVGLEASTQVETLASAVEACLSDLDLSVNEAGLLLLFRRFWPDGMLTDYALRRLCAAVINWILSEDQNLAIMLRNYVAKGRNLPGVPSGTEIQCWPQRTQSRPNLANSANNGGDYVVSRRRLLNLYASKWLLALHDLNIENYNAMVFDLLVANAEEGHLTDEYFLGKDTEEQQMKRRLDVADKLLKSIIKLSQASVVFTTFDVLFKGWLERAHHLGLDQEPLTSLSRLFSREVEMSQRFSSVLDSRVTMADASNLSTGSALQVLIDTATGSREGFQHTMHWLCLFVRSGVDISVSTFIQFTSLAERYHATLDESLLLIKAALWSTWLRSVGRQDLQTMVASLHAHLVSQVIESIRSRRDMRKIILFIRQSLAICLLVYGCERNYINGLGMIHDDDVHGLPSRRKLHSRNLTMTDPVIINTTLMDILKRYVETEIDEITCLVAKFLNAFVNDAPFVESYEVDNYILRNGTTLCTCLLVYGSAMVYKAPIYRLLLDDVFYSDSHWEVRLQAVLRLFRIILDVTNPAFNVEGRQWRTSVILVFHRFFSCLWTDEREEVRLAVDTWSQTLLEAHFDAIALCWNESLAKSPISERVRLVSFLNQLRPHFPAWPVLSWNLITETLLENEFMQRDGEDDEPAEDYLAMYGVSSRDSKHYAANMTVDPDLVLLRVSLLSLALRMISDGIPIDPISIVKMKYHVARGLGFQDVSMIPTTSGRSFHIRFSGLDDIPGSADACLNDLMLILDSSQPYDVAPSVMGGPYAEDETPCSLLVGSIFVDVILELFTNTEIAALPFITGKNMLKSLMIILYKHDFDSKPLQHLQGNLRRAVRRVLDLILLDLSYELHQLALSICQAFINRWPTIIGNFIIDAIETTIQLMVSLRFERNENDVLVDQARAFLATMLTLFASSGVFNVLCKRPQTSDFFAVIRYITTPSSKLLRAPPTQENLKDILLQDTLTRSIENEPEAFQPVIDNVATYVEAVYNTGYSSDAMQTVGFWLTTVARRTAEWPMGAFRPEPLLLLVCTLIQNNKAQSRDVLGYMETMIRAILIRCNVSTSSLIRVIEVTAQLYRRAAAVVPSAGASPANPIVLAMFETLTDTIRIRARASPATITALFKAITATAVAKLGSKDTILPDESIYTLASDAVLFLYGDNLPENLFQANFDASEAAAEMILAVARFQPAVLSRLSRFPAALRVWNILVLVALQSPSAAPAAMISEYFSAFSIAYCRSLSADQQLQHLQEVDPQDSANSDISGAYAAIKLWLLLVRKSAGQRPEATEGTYTGGDINMQDREILATKMVWNELWPPFERVITSLEAGAHAGNTSRIASVVWASVADLLLFLRQSRSIALDASSEVNILNRLRAVMGGESRLVRVTRSMTGPPAFLPFEFFVNQLATEIKAEERLHAAKRHDIEPEKGRRVAS